MHRKTEKGIVIHKCLLCSVFLWINIFLISAICTTKFSKMSQVGLWTVTFFIKIPHFFAEKTWQTSKIFAEADWIYFISSTGGDFYVTNFVVLKSKFASIISLRETKVNKFQTQNAIFSSCIQYLFMFISVNKKKNVLVKLSVTNQISFYSYYCYRKKIILWHLHIISVRTATGLWPGRRYDKTPHLGEVSHTRRGEAFYQRTCPWQNRSLESKII